MKRLLLLTLLPGIALGNGEIDRAALDRLAAEHRGEQWSVEVTRDDMTEARNVSLSMKANNRIRDSVGREVQPTLAVGCYQNTTMLVVSAPGVFFGSGQERVLVKLDDARATEQTWRAASDVIGPDSSIPLVRSLLAVDVLKVRVPIYREGTVDISFTVAGLERHIAKVQEACGWN